MAPLLIDSKKQTHFPEQRGYSGVVEAGADGSQSYWHFPYQSSKYSFVDFAVSKGYSVLFYDRVGAGESTK
jgi:hypothetical protein